MNRAVVITISDSGFQRLREDKSGPAVVEKLRQAGFDVTLRDAIPDEREQIAGVLRELADAGGRLAIFTTGGTGITPRDVTPEATRDVIERGSTRIRGIDAGQGTGIHAVCVAIEGDCGNAGRGFDRQSARIAARGSGISGCYFRVGPARAGLDKRTHGAFLVLNVC